jgi:hypothetical protein
LKNNIRLVIEKGATGITVAINAGATCCLEDYQNSITWYYSSGVLMLQYNNLNGLVTGIYSNFNQYWSGTLNRTDAVVNPTAPYSYIIDIFGSTYRMKNGTTGQIDYQSTNASQVERFADGNNTSGGTIFVRNGWYNIDAGWYVSERTRLIGEAENTTVLNITANCNAITVQNASASTFWEISNFYIDMNNYNGTGILALRAGQSGSKSSPIMNNIFVCHVATGNTGIWLQNPFFMYSHSVTVRANLGTGFKFTVDPTMTVDFGNSMFDEWTASVGANNGIGLYIEGNTYVNNLIQFNRLQLITSTSYTNTTGLWLKGARWINSVGLDVESFSYGIRISPNTGAYSNSTFNTFTGSAITGATIYSVWLEKGTWGNDFYGGMISVNNVTEDYVVYDENTVVTQRNLFNGVQFGIIGTGVGLYDFQYSCDVVNCGQFKTFNQGTLSSAKSGDYTNHLLKNTPTSVFVQYVGNSGVLSVNVNETTTSQFRIRVMNCTSNTEYTGTITTIYWQAWYDPSQ